MKMDRVEIPSEFQRNSPNVLALGLENTGSTLIRRGNELLGLPDLSGKDLLDVGCGVRFTQTIINRDLPIGSYTGVDVDEPLIAYLTDNIRDGRFSFRRWNVHNEMYNPTGERLTKTTRLPLSRRARFDVIWMYSVVTHTYPRDAECLFHILRDHVKRGGGMLFSAFIDNDIADFEDRVKDRPLLNAYYNEKFLRRMVSKAGWRVESVHDKWADGVTQNLLVCRPAFRLSRVFSGAAR